MHICLSYVLLINKKKKLKILFNPALGKIFNHADKPMNKYTLNICFPWINCTRIEAEWKISWINERNDEMKDDFKWKKCRKIKLKESKKKNEKVN